MSGNVRRLLAEIDALTQQERAELAHALMCSLEPEEPGSAQAWEEELGRRLARLRSGEAVEIPANHVFRPWRRDPS